MAYEQEMMRALIDNDEVRIDAIRRLNTSGSYINSLHNDSHDKLVASVSRNFRRTHQGFYPNER